MKEIMMEKEVEGKHVEKMVPENLASTYEKAGWTIKKQTQKSFASKPSTPKENNE